MPTLAMRVIAVKFNFVAGDFRAHLFQDNAPRKVVSPLFLGYAKGLNRVVGKKRGKDEITRGVLMFDFLFPNHPFGGHTLRLVAQAQQGGGDIFDIARARRLPPVTRAPPGNISFMRATTTVCPTCCSRLRKSPSAENAFANHRSSSAKRPSSMTPRS